MHTDPGSLLKINPTTKAIEDIALVDNGLSLTAENGVLIKRFRGPKEGDPISPVNKARLQDLIDHEEVLSPQLKQWLEPEAVAGLFARAKALLTRGRYGNFTLPEINAHLKDRQIDKEVSPGIDPIAEPGT